MPIRLPQVDRDSLDSGMCEFHRINYGRLKPLHVLRFSAHCQMPSWILGKLGMRQIVPRKANLWQPDRHASYYE